MHAHTSSSVSFRPFLFPTLVMFFFGWGGLALLFWVIKPTVWGRWGFYVLWLVALTGTALPVIHWFHRLSSTSPGIVLRQALWVGVYGTTLSWLTLNKLTNLWVIIGLAAGIVAVEYFTRLRERSQWHRPDVHDRLSPEDGLDDQP